MTRPTNLALIAANLTADALGNCYGRGVPLVKYKASQTTRSNNATPSLDPDLQVTFPAASSGVYLIETLCLITGDAVSFTGGINIGTYCGNYLTQSRSTAWYSLNNTNTILASSQPSSSTFATTYAFGSISNGSNDWIRFETVLWLPGSGTQTFAINWAQHVSNAGVTALNAGSCMKVIQLSQAP